MPIPRIEGAKMNAVTDDFVQLMKVDGNEYLFYPAVNVDVAIIRATTADPYGNLSYEEECSARCARPGVRRPQQRRHRDRPGQKTFRYPAGHSGSSYPRHSRRRDRDRPRQMQTTQTLYDPALSGRSTATSTTSSRSVWRR